MSSDGQTVQQTQDALNLDFLPVCNLVTSLCTDVAAQNERCLIFTRFSNTFQEQRSHLMQLQSSEAVINPASMDEEQRAQPFQVLNEMFLVAWLVANKVDIC